MERRLGSRGLYQRPGRGYREPQPECKSLSKKRLRSSRPSNRAATRSSHDAGARSTSRRVLQRPTRIVITAGPTHEPIDSVRFIGNRSSGRVGVALAEAAARLGWQTTLLLGPATVLPTDARVCVERFRTTSDLRVLLSKQIDFDVLVMAAAVADYRPIVDPAALAAAGNKLRRVSTGLTLKLEATPDLLAEIGARKTAAQVLVGFALEPAARLESSAREKLARKKLDLIVANELQTMDALTIQASVFDSQGGRHDTPGAMTKRRFATWLLKRIALSLSDTRRTL